MIDLLQQRLQSYNAANRLEEENAIKEILQEIALYALWRADFFDVALFQGGTSLRILHDLPRFSEDLDFILAKPDPEFNWTPYLNVLLQIFEEFGIQSEALRKGSMEQRIRKAVIKDTTIIKQLDLSFSGRNEREKIRIKLEIDVTPPAFSGEARTFLDFPLDYEVRHQDLSSNLALKTHALLCREYLKGRDWYDFSWYVAKGVTPNLQHLQAALLQFGPWSQERDIPVDMDWLHDAMTEKIASISWPQARDDVRRFLRPREAESLTLWSEVFFITKLAKLIQNIASN
ncbi:MAG: nucleotidyl transferase AbiEii/AbiGii toxin family protein [Aestuariivita sp.]|nr:nucleotidyl transferase AbiEii/AbiGii toxin family protein [Aestuariivita sp.]MCY4203375.1 nucleotidyl transferase AbiEii/AbiGii toxin family protein [Aestuariivita sp.]